MGLVWWLVSCLTLHGWVLRDQADGRRTKLDGPVDAWPLCGTRCHCNGDNSVIRCMNAAMRGIPSDLPVNLRELNLDGNMIGKLDAGVLSNMSGLRFLSLRSNNLSYIHEQAFAGLINLRTVALDNNWIENIPANVFLGCPNLKQLSLSNNFLNARVLKQALKSSQQLTTLDLSGNNLDGDIFPESVANLTHLKHLILRHTEFTNLTEDYFLPFTFISLHTLDLSHSRIIAACRGAFSAFLHLKQLDISYSQLPAKSMFDDLANTTLESITMKYTFAKPIKGDKIESDFFSGLTTTKVKYMYLNGNYYGFDRYLPSGLFDGLESLHEIYLENADLVSIPSGSLHGLRHLEKLDLRFNLFTCVASSSCDGLVGDVHFPSLQQLDLSHNAISTAVGNMRFRGRSFPRLYYLGLRNNSIDVIYRTLFSGLRALRYLELSHNPIHTIDAMSFNELSALQRLEIANCYSLGALRNDTFNGLMNLTSLHLHNNALSLLEAGALLGMPVLEELHLEHNHLFGDISSVPINSSQLISLNVEDNRLTQIPWAILQSSRNSIVFLNLGYNRIPSCDGFGDFPSLTELDLSHNLITEPSAHCFVNSVRNVSLNLAYNPFHCSCDTPSFTDTLKVSSVKILRQDYHTCASPAHLAGQPLFTYSTSQWECSLKAVVVPIITGITSAIFFLVMTAIIVVYSKHNVPNKHTRDHDVSEDTQGCSSACGIGTRTHSRRVSEERLIAEVDEDDEDSDPLRLADEQTRLCNGNVNSNKPSNGNCVRGVDEDVGFEMSPTSTDDCLARAVELQADVHYGADISTEVEKIIHGMIPESSQQAANAKYQCV